MEGNSNYPNSLGSGEELSKVIESRRKYLPETVEAAITEAQYRGLVFSDEELKTINEDIKTQRDNAAIGDQASSGLFNNNYKYNLVEDPKAPLLYSKRAIYIFTVLCGALFGSIMLAINSGKVKNYNGILWISLFGIVFTILQVIGSNYVNFGGYYAIFCGLTAGICIDRFFWKRLIGNSTFYRAKPIWVPLIIALLLGGLILWATFYNSSL